MRALHHGLRVGGCGPGDVIDLTVPGAGGRCFYGTGQQGAPSFVGSTAEPA